MALAGASHPVVPRVDVRFSARYVQQHGCARDESAFKQLE